MESGLKKSGKKKMMNLIVKRLILRTERDGEVLRKKEENWAMVLIGKAKNLILACKIQEVL